ncbi:MAG TPA: DNA alkylation repair protein [Candidatus Magasanikbacteria bacterium]|nr:DNA alkylation repair protein [Candidatus Magasanikbacteria bacterium]
MSIKLLKKELNKKASKEKAVILSRFFKTGPGQYGEGDKFLGVVVPDIRMTIKNFVDLDLSDLQKLLQSPYHEERLSSLLILVLKYPKATPAEQTEIYKFYLKNTKRINNWDLVDLTAEKIIGPYLENKDKKVLFKLAQSRNLWERRIAILSTFHYIKKGESRLTFEIAQILLNDKHDLMHKAVGWMLREVGKRCGEKTEEEFLKKHYKQMPRTMLRYAIERFAENKRLKYLKSKVKI